MNRYSIHLKNSEAGDHTPKCCWIRSLVSAGVSPEIRSVESGEGSGWQDRERYWIRRFKELGQPLMNATEGGEGRSPGTKLSPEVCARIGNATRGHVVSPDSRLLMSRNRKGIRLTPEQRTLQRLNARRGPKPIDEVRRMREKLTGLANRLFTVTAKRLI